MKKENRNTDKTFDDRTATYSWKDDHIPDVDDASLFERLSYYMKSRLDLEDVKNDPSLSAIDKDVKEMISDYHHKLSKNEDNEMFIREGFAAVNKDEELFKEIENINSEISSNNISEISAEWVKEWEGKKSNLTQNDPKEEEIRNFVSGSLDHEQRAKRASFMIKSDHASETRIVRFLSVTAAAVLGIFILIKSLLPSSDPEKIFRTYYEPFKIVSPVTRGVAAKEPDSYSIAQENYRLGNYQAAATGFTNVMLNDSSQVSAGFFLGLTQLATGDINNTIKMLDSSGVVFGEYGKDACWYLGLAYIKTGEKEKAAKCFKSLAASQGFYSKRAGKILRRLK